MANQNANTGDGLDPRDTSGLASNVKKDQGDYNNLIRDSVRELDKVSRKYDEINSKIQASNDLNKDIKDIETDILKSLSKELQLKTELAKIDSSVATSASTKLTKIAQLREQEKKQQKELSALAITGAKAQNKKADSLTRQLNQTIALLEVEESSLSVEEARYIALLKALETVEETTDQLTAQKALQGQINDRMGSLGKLAKGLAGVIDKLGLGGFLQIDKTIEKMRLAAKDGASKWQIFGIAIKDTFVAVGDALRNPLVIIGGIYSIMKKLVNVALEYQDKTFTAGKNLGLNLTQSEKLFKQFQGIAWQNSQMALTAKQLVETYAQVNNTLGFMGPKNAEFLTTTAGIQRRIGATAEDMLNIQYYSLATGKNLKDGYASIIGSAKATAAKLRLDLTEKQILEGISKVSATVFNNFRGNVEQIGKAVVTATKLGVTLDQINSAGMSLLDFESSISKEFEAQLLTGKQIDLSRARQLALTGSTAELMTELTDTLGTQAEWNNMNVLKQQSLAEALGFTKEQVDEIFRKQELSNVLGAQAGADALTQYNLLKAQGKSHAEIADLIGKQSAEDALRASASEKLQATMERIKDTIGQMTQGITRMVEGFANFIGDADNLKKIFIGISAVVGGIATASIAMSLARRQQLITEREIAITNNRLLATQILQNTQETGLLAKKELEQIAETGITRTRIIGAGAAATAGSGYLGPLALGVGAAVIAGLLAYLGTGGIGGGGASSSASAPTVPSISPVNPTVAGAAAQPQGQSFNTSGIAPVNQTNVAIQVEGQTILKTSWKTQNQNGATTNYDNTKVNPATG